MILMASPPGRKAKSRLKLYIPQAKVQLWSKALEERDVNSIFFTNFSRWVNQCLERNLPSPADIPLYPLYSVRPEAGEDKQGQEIFEKTIWVSNTVKTALKKMRGHLSLNAYVILVLDLSVFEAASVETLAYQIRHLEARVSQLNNEVYRLRDLYSTTMAPHHKPSP